MEYGRLRIRHKGALTPSVSGFFSSLRSTDGFTSVIAGQCPTPGHQYLTSMRAAISTLDGPRHSVLVQVAVVAAYVNAGPSRDMEPSGNRRRRRFGLGAPAIAF